MTAPEPWRSNAHPGDILFTAPETPPAVWGDGSEVLWAQGEALVIAGPQGTGKTSVAGQLLRARLGLQDGFLGFPVQPSNGRCLYLAMDRPEQAVRSMRRQFRHADEATLRDRLVIRKGPPAFDVALYELAYLDAARAFDADTIIVDSIKDAAVGISEDKIGAGYNRARQHALAAGIQIVELHHQVKRGANGGRADTLADVYGSTWITSGAGSVLLLWGEAGDPVVTLTHLKQPMHSVGPLTLQHDNTTGITTVVGDNDPAQLLIAAGDRGITAKHLAEVLYGKTDRNQVAKARRKLDLLVTKGIARKTSRSLAPGEGGTAESIYTAHGQLESVA